MSKKRKLPPKDLAAVGRMAAMNYFPKEAIGQKAIMDAFSGACFDKTRVDQAVQHFLDEFDECPTPHQIKTYCFASHLHLKNGVSRLATLRKTDECTLCDGYGRAPGKSTTATEGPFKGQVYEHLVYCTCAIGQELKRIEAAKEKK